MHEIINKSLFAGDKFIPATHFIQPGFTYSSCELFTKNKKRTKKKIRKTRDSKYIYQNELDKAWIKELDKAR